MKLSLLAILLGLAALTGKLGAASGVALLIAFLLFGIEILRMLAALFGARAPEANPNPTNDAWSWGLLALGSVIWVIISPSPAAAALAVALVVGIIAGLKSKTPR